MIRRPPRSNRTDTLVPDPTLFRSRLGRSAAARSRLWRQGAVDRDLRRPAADGLFPQGQRRSRARARRLERKSEELFLARAGQEIEADAYPFRPEHRREAMGQKGDRSLLG